MFNAPTRAVIDSQGNLFVTDTGNNKIKKITPAGVVSVFAGPAIGDQSTGTTDGATTRCRGELYNCTTNPAETLGFIQSSFGEFSISGDCKMDPVRQLDPNFGPFGRLLLFQPT